MPLSFEYIARCAKLALTGDYTSLRRLFAFFVSFSPGYFIDWLTCPFNFVQLLDGSANVSRQEHRVPGLASHDTKPRASIDDLHCRTQPSRLVLLEVADEPLAKSGIAHASCYRSDCRAVGCVN